jgi:hypothetical protein
LALFLPLLTNNQRGIMHFVRRRCFKRSKSFDPALLWAGPGANACDHCDSEEVAKLSKYLLEALAVASKLEESGGPTDGTVLPLKRKLLALLALDKPLKPLKEGEVFTRLEVPSAIVWGIPRVGGSRPCLSRATYEYFDPDCTFLTPFLDTFC